MNTFATVPANLIDVVLPEDGYPVSLAAGDTRDVLRGVCGDASRDFPAALHIDPKDWPDAARENDKHSTWAFNYLDRFTHQGSSHECTCHSLSRTFEAARNRARGMVYGGPEAGKRLDASSQFGSVWVSPISVYAEANPDQWGGASIRRVLEIATRRGFLPDKIQPRDYGFKHTLHGTAGGTGSINQSAGPWTSVGRFPEGWKETAKHFRVIEVIFPETWEQIVCLVLHGYAVCVGRNGHAIPYTMWNPEQQVMGYVDSYNLVRWDSLRTLKSAVGGAYTIATVTLPDDWSRPAGDA